MCALLFTGTIELGLGRPVCVRVREELVQSAMHTVKQLKLLVPENTDQESPQDTACARRPRNPVKPSQEDHPGLPPKSNFLLNTSQLVVCFDGRQFGAQASLASIMGRVGPGQGSLSTEPLSGEVQVLGLAAKLTSSDQTASLPLVQPLAVAVRGKQWCTGPASTVFSDLHCNTTPIALQICQRRVEEMKALVEEIQSMLEEHIARDSGGDDEEDVVVSPNRPEASELSQPGDDLRNFALVKLGVLQTRLPYSGERVLVAPDSATGKRTSMSWTYVEPRHVDELVVTPIPWPAGEEPEEVICTLEVWNPEASKFDRVLRFDLCVGQLRRFDVSARCGGGKTWRVTADQNIAPELVAACIRTRSSILHGVSARMNLPSITLHIFNAYASSPKDERHLPLQDFLLQQEVAQLEFRKWTGALWACDRRTGVLLGGDCQLKVVDFGSQILRRLVDVQSIEGVWNGSSLDVGVGEVDVKVAASLLRNLELTARMWSNPRALNPPVLHHYIVRNFCCEALVLRQSDEAKEVELRPSHSFAYSWSSPCYKPLLQVAVASNSDRQFCKAINIDTTGRRVRALSLGAGRGAAYLIAEINETDAVQRTISLFGSVTVCSYHPENLDVHWSIKKDGAEDEKKDERGALGYVSPLGSMSTLPSFLLADGHTMMLRLRCPQSKAWSPSVPVACLPEGNQHQSLPVPTGREWPLIHVFVHTRVVSALGKCRPLLVTLTTQMVIRNHMPRAIGIQMTPKSGGAPHQVWIPGGGKQMSLGHLGLNELYGSTFQLDGVKFMSQNEMTLSLELRSKVPSIQPPADTSLLRYLPEHRVVEDRRLHWPYVWFEGMRAKEVIGFGTQKQRLDLFLLRYIQLISDPTRAVTCEEDGLHPCAVEKDLADASQKLTVQHHRSQVVSFSLSAVLSLFSALTLFSHAHLWSLKLSLKMRVSSKELFSTLKVTGRAEVVVNHLSSRHKLSSFMSLPLLFCAILSHASIFILGVLQ